MSDPLSPQPSPWRGPDSFTEADAHEFFGRTRETKRLLRLVEGGLLTVLFGDSGLGKTSLIRAGLFPELRKRCFTPVYFRLRFEEGAPSPIEQVWQRLDEIAGVDKVDGAWPSDLWGWFHDRKNGLFSERLDGASLVLVFDQFEELFTKGGGGERREFLEQLAELAENRVPEAIREAVGAKGGSEEDERRIEAVRRRYFGDGGVESEPYRILLSLRAEYLYLFDRLSGMMQSGMKRRMELEPMARKEAMEAIRRPAPQLVSKEVAELLVDRIAGGREDDWGGDLPLDGEKPVWIQPGVLSLVCDRLNRERIREGRSEISAGQINEKFDEIFDNYYDEAFERLDPEARRFVEARMVDAEGHRLLLEHRFVEEGIGAGAMDSLFESRLLKGEERSNKKYVELVHDRFAAVALKRRRSREEGEQAEERRRREEAEAEARALAAREEAEREARKVEELRKVREDSEKRVRGLEEKNRLAEEEGRKRASDLVLLEKLRRKTIKVFSGMMVLGLAVSAGFYLFARSEAIRLRDEAAIAGAKLLDSNAALEDSREAQAALQGELGSMRSQLDELSKRSEESSSRLAGTEAELSESKEKLAESSQVLEEYARREADFGRSVEEARKAQLDREQLALRFKTASEELGEVKKENDQLKIRIAALEKSLPAKPPGDPGPPMVAPAPSAEDLAERRRAAMALVGDFLDAGAGKGSRNQWEFFGEEGGDFGSPGAKTKSEIEEVVRRELETKRKSYWLKAPPWVVEEGGGEWVLRALYASRVGIPGDETARPHVSESEFRIAFDRGPTPVLRSFVTKAASYNRPEDGEEMYLSGVDQFDRIFRIRHDWSFDSRVDRMERDGWLALMTNELYVLAGQSYPDAELAPLTDRDVVRKISDQSELFAETLLYFTYGEISRKDAAEKLVRYRVASPTRTLQILEKPEVTYDRDERLWTVRCRLVSHTEGNGKATTVERLSTMQVRIDEARGPEIAAVVGEDVEGTRIEVPKN